MVKDYVAAKDTLKTLEDEKKKLEKEFEAKLLEAEEKMKEVFQSPYLLPGMWAAMFPMMMPYGGGIVPPPFPGGPPSTVPGMIYIALLLIDAIEEKTHDRIQGLGNDPNCEDEL
jgi:CRISPR/Cas system-associated protein Cas5 (RAMP superfamily)